MEMSEFLDMEIFADITKIMPWNYCLGQDIWMSMLLSRVVKNLYARWNDIEEKEFVVYFSKSLTTRDFELKFLAEKIILHGKFHFQYSPYAAVPGMFWPPRVLLMFTGRTCLRCSIALISHVFIICAWRFASALIHSRLYPIQTIGDTASVSGFPSELEGDKYLPKHF